MSKRARNGTIMGGSRRPKRSGCVTAEGKIRWDVDEKEPEPLPPLEWMPTHWKEEPFRPAISAMRPLVVCTEMCTPEQDPDHVWQTLSRNMWCAPPYLVYALVLIQRALQGVVHVAKYKDTYHQTFDRIFSHQKNYMMRMVWFSVAMRLATKNEEDECTWPAEYVVRISEMCELKMTAKAASDMELYLLRRMGWRSHVTLETYQRVVSLLCAYRPTDKWRRELSEACSSHD